MVRHGLAPLFVDGRPTELNDWGFSPDVVRRLTRLNELYDRQMNLEGPRETQPPVSDRDRFEFNALLPYVVSEVQQALGTDWEVVLDNQAL
jgi:hypothetical protein